MIDYAEQERALHEPFDLDRHKRLFKNYLEVVILPDGTVEYAVPSHQEKAIRILQKKTGETREQIFDRTPPEYYFDLLTWLCLETGCLLVWDKFCIGAPNKAQIRTLEKLKEAGLYAGEIEKENEKC